MSRGLDPRSVSLAAFFYLWLCGPLPGQWAIAAAPNSNPPSAPAKLIFIHHSTGENWLNDESGGLGLALRNNNYFVSDTNYGWGPADADAGSGRIGDHTDIGHWHSWFSGPRRDQHTSALFAESSQNCSYSRLGRDPGGQNQIIVFKSCFPNSQLEGNPGDLCRPSLTTRCAGRTAGPRPTPSPIPRASTWRS